ncbi:MAG: NUDIX hydrolase [Planctomycetota bacterium]
MTSDAPLVRAIEIVEDRTASSSCDRGFLRLRRLIIRNRYPDGSASAPYPCDIVTRPSADAVAICLYRVEADAPAGRRVLVLLKESPRAPVFFRTLRHLVVPDPAPYLSVIELVAGLIEDGDDGVDGIERRAASEAEEEAGQQLAVTQVTRLGAGSFASPGISDEKVYFCSAPLERLDGAAPTGDGSVMEEATRVVVFDLRAAIRACRDGRIPDLKTEVGLLRLADRLGYLPQLDLFAHELPEHLRSSIDNLGSAQN